MFGRLFNLPSRTLDYIIYIDYSIILTFPAWNWRQVSFHEYPDPKHRSQTRAFLINGSRSKVFINRAGIRIYYKGSTFIPLSDTLNINLSCLTDLDLNSSLIGAEYFQNTRIRYSGVRATYPPPWSRRGTAWPTARIARTAGSGPAWIIRWSLLQLTPQIEIKCKYEKYCRW